MATNRQANSRWAGWHANESNWSQVAEQSLAPQPSSRRRALCAHSDGTNLFVPHVFKSWLRCKSELTHFDFSHCTRHFIWCQRFSTILLLKRPRQFPSSAQISLEIQSQNQIHNYKAFQLTFLTKTKVSTHVCSNTCPGSTTKCTRGDTFHSQPPSVLTFGIDINSVMSLQSTHCYKKSTFFF